MAKSWTHPVDSLQKIRGRAMETRLIESDERFYSSTRWQLRSWKRILIFMAWKPSDTHSDWARFEPWMITWMDGEQVPKRSMSAQIIRSYRQAWPICNHLLRALINQQTWMRNKNKATRTTVGRKRSRQWDLGRREEGAGPEKAINVKIGASIRFPSWR